MSSKPLSPRYLVKYTIEAHPTKFWKKFLKFLREFLKAFSKLLQTESIVSVMIFLKLED